MSVPKQELPQNMPQEALPTPDLLHDLSRDITSMSPAYLSERGAALDASWNDQRLLAAQVQQNAFANPYIYG